jgi:hypothetical protein
MGGQSVRQVVLRRHSHSLGSAAMQSLHNVRSLGLLWDVANPEAWSCLEFSVGSRLGLRSYAAQPNLNYYQAGINHKYERPQHVPRRWQPPPASGEEPFSSRGFLLVHVLKLRYRCQYT